MSAVNKHVVIVAGGSGSRMKKDLPKQFLLLQGRPILMHTVEAFYLYDKSINIILVLPKEHTGYWEELLYRYEFEIPHSIALGGKTRSDSVFNGLKKIDNSGLVAIHDGARPLVDKQIIEDAFLNAASTGSGVAAVQLKDSIRHVHDDKNMHLDRSQYRLVQTPQTFDVEAIKQAFQMREEGVEYSDDASVFEAAGHAISLSEGSYENLKITTPEDLYIAEAILQSRQ